MRRINISGDFIYSSRDHDQQKRAVLEKIRIVLRENYYYIAELSTEDGSVILTEFD
jgi:hypothetical protein